MLLLPSHKNGLSNVKVCQPTVAVLGMLPASITVVKPVIKGSPFAIVVPVV